MVNTLAPGISAIICSIVFRGCLGLRRALLRWTGSMQILTEPSFFFCCNHGWYLLCCLGYRCYHIQLSHVVQFCFDFSFIAIGIFRGAQTTGVLSSLIWYTTGRLPMTSQSKRSLYSRTSGASWCSMCTSGPITMLSCRPRRGFTSHYMERKFPTDALQHCGSFSVNCLSSISHKIHSLCCVDRGCLSQTVTLLTAEINRVTVEGVLQIVIWLCTQLMYLTHLLGPRLVVSLSSCWLCCWPAASCKVV